MHPVRTIARTTALLVALALPLAACGASGNDPLNNNDGSGSSTSGEQVVVGSADFSESVLLAEIYAGALRAKGINASTKTGIGAREIYLKALEDGSVDVVPEYTGALALYYDPKFDQKDPEKVYEAVRGLVPQDLVLLEKSAAEDKDSLVVTQDTAKKDSLTTMSDLAKVSGGLTLGGPPEMKERPQGLPGLKKDYGMEFGSFRPIKGSLLSEALKNGQVDVANIFSTDPSIAANGFVVLKDDKKHYGSQNVVPLVRQDKAEAVTDALNAVSAKLTTEVLSGLLQQTDIEKKDHAAVAETFLKDNGLAG